MITRQSSFPLKCKWRQTTSRVMKLAPAFTRKHTSKTDTKVPFSIWTLVKSHSFVPHMLSIAESRPIPAKVIVVDRLLAVSLLLMKLRTKSEYLRAMKFLHFGAWLHTDSLIWLLAVLALVLASDRVFTPKSPISWILSPLTLTVSALTLMHKKVKTVLFCLPPAPHAKNFMARS